MEKVDEKVNLESKDANNSENMAGDTVSKKKSKIIFIVIGVILVVLIAAVLFLRQAPSTAKADAKNQCNFNNTAHFAYDETSIYYIGKYDESSSESCLFSTSYNGTNRKIILQNDDIVRMRICGDQIVYYTEDDGSYSLGIANKDGTEDKTIVTLDDTVGEFNLYNEKLYYQSDSEIHVCTLEGAEDEIILSDVKDFVVAGKYLYYSSNSVISSYDLKKQTTLELCAASDATDLVYDNGMIYFKTDNGLYFTSAKEESVAKRVVSDSEISHYVIDGDTIYYISKLTTEEIIALAKYMAGDDGDYVTYGIAMLNVGELMRVDKSGGYEEAQDSNQMIIYALFGAPQDLYCKISVFSDKYEKIELK